MSEAAIPIKKKKKEEGGVEIDKDAWMLTFSDLLQLLITFFVLLISMSSMDSKTLNDMFMLFTQQPGLLYNTERTWDKPQPQMELIPRNIDLDEMKESLRYHALDVEATNRAKELVRTHLTTILTSGIEISRRGRDFALVLPEDALFEEGQVLLNPKLVPSLERIALIISLSKNKVILEGHTDDRKGGLGYLHSNWEVSAARASSVFQYLLGTGLISPDRMEARGHAAYRPKVKNMNDYLRSRNRRVEIIIKQFEEDSY